MAGVASALTFAVEAHSSDAIQRAAYKFTDVFALELKRDGDDFLCSLHPVVGTFVDGETLNAFRSEILDQTLRERIRSETAAVRNAVLALAFSNVDLDSVTDSSANDRASAADAGSVPPRAG